MVNVGWSPSTCAGLTSCQTKQLNGPSSKRWEQNDSNTHQADTLLIRSVYGSIETVCVLHVRSAEPAVSVVVRTATRAARINGVSDLSVSVRYAAETCQQQGSVN